MSCPPFIRVVLFALLFESSSQSQTPSQVGSGPEPERIQRKLNEIIIPRIDFKNTSIQEAIRFLHKKSVELDSEERKGVDIRFVPLEANPNPEPPELGTPPNSSEHEGTNLELSNIPLGDALDYVVRIANLLMVIGSREVVITSPRNTAMLMRMEYSVPSGFFPKKNGITQDARDFLESEGAVFPPEATADYLPNANRLIVYNTPQQQDFIEGLLEVARPGGGPFDGPTPSWVVLTEKLDKIIIPHLSFGDATLTEIIDALRKKGGELTGLNIILKLDESIMFGAGGVIDLDQKYMRFTLELQDISVLEALRQIAKMANLKLIVESHAVSIGPYPAYPGIRSYNLPPGFIPERDGIPMKAREFLEAQGVKFSPGENATFHPDFKSNQLVAELSLKNQELVESMVTTAIIEYYRKKNEQD